MSKPENLDLIRRLDPIANDDPAAAVSAESREELRTRIGHSPAGPATRVVGTANAGAGRPAVRRPLARKLVPVLAVGALVAGAAVTLIERPGGTKQEALGPALSFVTEGNVMKVKILDPEADSARFNKEFEAHGLNIKLRLLPVSPSVVGTSPAAGFSEGSDWIKTTFEPAGCLQAMTSPCVPEFTIPLPYKGQADLYIGRTAKPGEELASAGDLAARGEPLAGVKYQGMTVGAVKKLLTDRGVSAEYRVNVRPNYTDARDEVPANWIVREGTLLKLDHAVLFVSAPR
ncbi:hypothetical protein [Kribbella solani]|uniref:PASTA domain-containing protein n=1 Tax=Kribbella solani TaxID=236067 RepID=A0A841DMA1_9ACTN|nr:hypothetical protein [Kribbella solani]MBB5980244.1 hypothetical protein [Kribbella solani]